MKRYLHGIHVAGHKSTAQMSAVKLPLPDSVVIPMAMHIGAPAKPVVKVGDYVKTGQLIGGRLCLRTDLRKRLRHREENRRNAGLERTDDADS